MKTEIEKRIDTCVREHLSPTKAERELISQRYITLSGLLQGVVFQSGSYARYTSLTPVNDLDVIWQLPPALAETIKSDAAIFKAIDPNTLDIRRILQDLANRLAYECKQASLNVRIRAQSHSVGIYFGETDEEFSIDVVPAIPSGEFNEYGDCIYIVPDISMVRKSVRAAKYASNAQISWLKSDPRGYKKAAELLNIQTDSYRKTAKIVKAWKRACKDRHNSFPLKSFHLEIIVQAITSQDTTLDTIEAVAQVYSIMPSCVNAPRYLDRADANRYIDEYIRDLDLQTRRLVHSEIAQANSILAQIASETDANKAENALRRLIGLPINNPAASVWTTAVTTRPYYESN